MIRKLLDSIDRSTSMGKRDYAMMLLIATYGLRSSEVAGLKFDDIQWRTNRLRVFQPKTTSPLILPLVDEVGKAILDYLQSGRPAVPCRQVFVRHKIPIGNLERTGVTDAFQSCVRKSGLPIPFQGPHCLRHSYAVYLLRQGTSIKVIGDVLGHRSFESTCVYLRLGIEDLRAVPLSLPTPSNNTEAGHE
jgi:site-specific recombinase XerD